MRPKSEHVTELGLLLQALINLPRKSHINLISNWTLAHTSQPCQLNYSKTTRQNPSTFILSSQTEMLLLFNEQYCCSYC